MKEGRADGSPCHEIEPLLSSYAAGALDEASETRARDHLASCAACRAAQIGRDPAALFLELRRVPLPPGFLDRIPAEVRRRVEGRSAWAPLFAWLPAFSARRLAYVAAPVMTLLLLATLFLVRPGGPGPRGPRAPGGNGASSPFVVPPGSARLGKPEARGGALLPQLQPGAAGALASAPPLMEEIGSPGARVYRFTVESGGDETPIYFVVDETIDI